MNDVKKPIANGVVKAVFGEFVACEEHVTVRVKGVMMRAGACGGQKWGGQGETKLALKGNLKTR